VRAADPLGLARRIQTAVLAETRLRCSVGIGPPTKVMVTSMSMRGA